ncbi:hypothetical protein Droror1_Dr00020505 [Drosera rotundifolia]
MLSGILWMKMVERKYPGRFPRYSFNLKFSSNLPRDACCVLDWLRVEEEAMGSLHNQTGPVYMVDVGPVEGLMVVGLFQLLGHRKQGDKVRCVVLGQFKDFWVFFKEPGPLLKGRKQGFGSTKAIGSTVHCVLFRKNGLFG